jgi:hypothetical protein
MPVAIRRFPLALETRQAAHHPALSFSLGQDHQLATR